MGGIEVVVLEETFGEGETKRRKKEPKEKNKNKETVLMTITKTIKRLREDKKTDEDLTYPEMPRPDVPRDIEEQTISETVKNIQKDEEEYK